MTRRDALSRLFVVSLASIVLLSCISPMPRATTVPRTPIPTATRSAQATVPGDSVSPTVVPFAGEPLTDFFTGSFVGSGACSFCHGGLRDTRGNDVSIDTHWRSTMMANAAKDPLWQAKVSSEVARNPALEAVIEKKCATCHMPMAHTQASADGGETAILGDGFADPEHDLNAAAMDGVSCTLCHQIRDVGLGEEESFSGYYAIDTTLQPPDRLAYGPFSDPLQPQMRMHVGYTPVEGRHTLDAGLCATCHTLYTPYVDAAGNVAGTFPEQTPYLEWENSVYGPGSGGGIACQACHMPIAKGEVAISTRPMGRMISPRAPFAEHHFVGGNTFMLNVFRAFGQELGLTAGTADLDDTLARTRTQLESDAARLSIPKAGVGDGRLTVTLEVSNLAGHKFPTGFPSRRAWVHLTVTGPDGGVVFESGRPQPDGSIVGSDADEDAGAHEPHYDLITDPDQVQIYESIMQNSDGAVTYTLLRGAAYVKDNRLLPSGFDVAGASADIAVRGAAASDEGFAGGEDQITYQIDLAGRAGPYTVSAELLYQSVSYRFAMDLRQDDTPVVERMSRYYDAADHTPVVVASAEAQVR